MPRLSLQKLECNATCIQHGCISTRGTERAFAKDDGNNKLMGKGSVGRGWKRGRRDTDVRPGATALKTRGRRTAVEQPLLSGHAIVIVTAIIIIELIVISLGPPFAISSGAVACELQT